MVVSFIFFVSVQCYRERFSLKRLEVGFGLIIIAHLFHKAGEGSAVFLMSDVSLIIFGE